MKLTTQDWHYQCPYCMETFLRAEAFQKHTKKFHGFKVTACRSCPMFFDELNLLFLHARQIHNLKTREGKKECKHSCLYFPSCTYQTNNGGLMVHHLRSHTNNKPYECKICKKRFTQKSNMKTHFNRHKKNEFKFECIPCEKNFNSHDIYLSHLETREHYLGEIQSKNQVIFQCMVCQETFNNPVNTYCHSEVCKVADESQIACCTCHQVLPYDLHSLDLHHKNHKNEMICPFCENLTTFNDKTSFNFHITKKHQAKVDRRKACRYCEKIFENEEERNNHIELEHQNLKNKHQINKLDGRIKCKFEKCVFTSNSEIMIQKHLQMHCKNLNLDLFYEKEFKVENDNLSAETNKKRGRPRLCDSTETHGSLSTVTSDSEEPKRKRGRPKKFDINPSFSMSENKEIRKCVRAKNIKTEELVLTANDNFITEKIEETEYNIELIDEHLQFNEGLMESYNSTLGNNMKVEEIETFEV